MFSIFRSVPTFPVTLEERVWIERGMRRMRDDFPEQFRGAVKMIQSTSPLFSFPTPLTAANLVELTQSISAIMGIRSAVTLQVIADHELPLFHGDTLPQPDRVRLASSNAAHTGPAVAALAQELGRSLLLERCRRDPADQDLDFHAALTAICFGFGIVTANFALTDHYQRGLSYYAWEMSRIGTLSALQQGYALAVFCWLRRDVPGHWQRDLCFDARDTLRRGLKFLERSDSQLLFERKPGLTELASYWEERLANSSPAIVFDALCDMSEHRAALPEYLTPLIQRTLQHKDAVIVAMALRVLFRQPQIGRTLERDVLDCLCHPSTRIRRYAVTVLSELPMSQETYDALINCTFLEKSHEVRVGIELLLARDLQPQDHERLLMGIFQDLRIALNNQSHETVAILVKAIDNMTGDVGPIIQQRFLTSEMDEWAAILQECLKTMNQEKLTA